MADQTRFYNRLNRNYSLKATEWDTVMNQSVAKHWSLPSFKMGLKTLSMKPFSTVESGATLHSKVHASTAFTLLYHEKSPGELLKSKTTSS